MPDGGLMTIFAHPDDETFGVGGIMAACAQAGLPVTIVCATRGEVGQIAAGTDATPETLGAHREQELRDAGAILGVRDVRFLGFRDSGMRGTPENDDPRAYIKAPADAVVEPIVRAIRDARPRIVVTWDESGGYGHPDHVAVHHHATSAFRAAADGERYPDAGQPWAPERLFYVALPIEEFVRFMEEAAKYGGGPDFDPPGDSDNDFIAGLPRVQPNCIVDVSAQFEKKQAALLAHRTQMSDMELLLKVPEDVLRSFFAREFFYLAHPELASGASLDDLFAPPPAQ